MKQCPTCQRTYAEDNMTFCLDDGTPLSNVEASAFDGPQTLRMPEPRVTDQPAQPFAPPSPQPFYTQPRAAAGFKFTNRMLGISGAALLLLGTLMPLITVMGLLNFSLFTFIQGVPTGPASMSNAANVLVLLRIAGLLVLLLSAGSLLLAWKNQLKPLIATGAPPEEIAKTVASLRKGDAEIIRAARDAADALAAR